MVRVGGIKMTINEIETRLINLENAFIQSQKNIVTTVEKADKTVSLEQSTSVNENNIVTNTSDISDNRQGLTETFESTLTNADDVAINRQAIEELFEMITAESEVK